jgi:hypothetical protein
MVSYRSTASACRAISDSEKICDGVNKGMLVVVAWRTGKQYASIRYLLDCKAGNLSRYLDDVVCWKWTV